MRKTIEVKEEIIPVLMKDEKGYYDIVSIDPKYIIKSHKIILEDERVKKVIIEGLHPNAARDTNELCLPDEIWGEKYDEMDGILIKFLLSQHNLEYYYFMPKDGEIKYKKKENMYKLNMENKTVSKL